ncbi:MAG TPA: 3-methylornithine--L-lysine ligase PylC [Anaerovoracaceae bacterium]|nr:3-methylornithine--L-lysine ligase PylC [Anaerovoracaceae bacterium]
MKIVIIGGKLQGTEAIYLAKKAGYHSILIDINENVMSAKLCDEFVCGDIINRDENVMTALSEADIIIPTMENMEVIKAIGKISLEYNLNVAFDFEAYMITQSKLKSDELFHKNHIPSPKYYPNCQPPYILKPICESGSHGIIKINTKEELDKIDNLSDYIIQEYLEGPSYSIEIIGNREKYKTFEITKIHMDDVFDCKRVTAPCNISKETENKFKKIAIKIAKLVELNGIMDVEAILHRGELKILEIDARMPSQTPSVVLMTTGVNLLKELIELKLNGRFTEDEFDKKLYGTYENYSLIDGVLLNQGEHIMGDAKYLKHAKDLFGYKDVIWDYKESNCFSGIFINSALTKEKIEEDKNNLIDELKKLK